MSKLKQISIVLADWCPHCVPISLEMTKKMAEDLHVPYKVLDIDDSEGEKAADRLVMEHGDDSEDYLIPQVFLEFADGSIEHFFTGQSEGVSVTTQGWENIFKSQFYKNLKAQQSN